MKRNFFPEAVIDASNGYSEQGLLASSGEVTKLVKPIYQLANFIEQYGAYAYAYGA